MADALELPDDDGYAYVKWAWIPPEGERLITPAGDKQDERRLL